MRKLLLFFSFMLFLLPAYCYHIAGGDLTTKHVGGNNFEITLTIFRDCSNPSGADFDQEITLGIFNIINNNLYDTIHMSLNSYSGLNYSGPGCISPPQVCMQQGIYRRTINLPPVTGGYYLIWERCCRNNTVINLENPDHTGMAFYAVIADPILQNNSPIFKDPPLPYVCVGNLFRIPFSAIDIDGDSLVYQLSVPLEGGNTSNNDPNPFNPLGDDLIPFPAPYSPITWSGSYSLQNVCGGTPTLNINSYTGMVEGTTDNVGMYAMAVTVLEYRNGILIGQTRREIEITSIPCTGNNAPSVTTNFSSNTIEIFASDTLSIDVVAKDKNTDSLNLIYYGEIFNDSATTIQAPFANCYDTVGIGQVSSQLIWNTTCHQHRDSAYMVFFEITDNGCPIPLTNRTRISIIVKPSPIITPPLLLCHEIISDSTLKINLGYRDTLYEKYFQSYQIYRSENGGTFQLIDEIYTYQPKYYIDSTVLLNTGNSYCYYITSKNRCSRMGVNTDTLCTDKLSENKLYIELVTVEDENKIKIKWNHFEEQPFGEILIDKKINGSGYSRFGTYNKSWHQEIIDKAVFTNKYGYCYKIQFKNACNELLPISEEICSILLQGEALNFSHNLKWNNYKNAADSILEHELIRGSNKNEYFMLSLHSFHQSDSIYEDQDIIDQGAKFKYKIISKGLKFGESHSNIVELVQQPILYLPNSFTPNGDLKNEVWRGFSLFIEKFQLEIYNRWGQKLFETDDKSFEWNGQFENQELSQDIYCYKVKYKGYNTAEWTTRVGTIHLIR